MNKPMIGNCCGCQSYPSTLYKVSENRYRCGACFEKETGNPAPGIRIAIGDAATQSPRQMSVIEARLITFAVDVLEVLADDHDWDSETMDDVGASAYRQKLAELNDDEFFDIAKEASAAIDKAFADARRVIEAQSTKGGV